MTRTWPGRRGALPLVALALPLLAAPLGAQDAAVKLGIGAASGAATGAALGYAVCDETVRSRGSCAGIGALRVGAAGAAGAGLLLLTGTGTAGVLATGGLTGAAAGAGLGALACEEGDQAVCAATSAAALGAAGLLTAGVMRAVRPRWPLGPVVGAVAGFGTGTATVAVLCAFGNGDAPLGSCVADGVPTFGGFLAAVGLLAGVIVSGPETRSALPGRPRLDVAPGRRGAWTIRASIAH